MRAINSQELQAIRDNRNQWKIAPDALDRWRASTVRTPPDLHTLPTSEAIDVERLKGQLETERQLRLAAETDRDHWRDMAQKLASQPRRWWPWGTKF